MHPVYQDDSNELYRPLHHDIWNSHKSWGQSGADFNASINALWGDAIHENSGTAGVSKVMSNLSPEVIKTIGYGELESAYLQYFEILKSQVPLAEASLPIPGITEDETELSKKFVQYRKTYVQEYPFQSYALVPVKVYFSLGAHSNLSLYVFQKSWLGNLFMEMLRYFSFILHFGVFILFSTYLYAKVTTLASGFYSYTDVPRILMCCAKRSGRTLYTTGFNSHADARLSCYG